MKHTHPHDKHPDGTHIQKGHIFRQNTYSKSIHTKKTHIQVEYIFKEDTYSKRIHIQIESIQSPLFISMRRDRHPYAYGAFMLVRRVDLSHTNLVGTRVGMLVGGLCLYTVCL